MLFAIGLSLTKQAQAASPRSVVLVGLPGECGMQRVADELRAAAYTVLIAAVEASPDESELPRIAERAASRAAVSLHSSSQGCSVAIHVVDASRGESTLRRLPPRLLDATSAESLLALRVVEIVNATLLEVEREQPARELQVRPVSNPAVPKTKPRIGVDIAGGGRVMWLNTEGAPFVGPELSARLSSPANWYFEAAGFVSASSHRVEAAAGSARAQLMAATIGGGHAFPLLPRLALGLGLSAHFVGAWATATPAEGYREVQTFSRSAAIVGAGELDLGLSRSLAIRASLGAGYVMPRIEMAMASVPSQVFGPWLVQAGIGLRVEWQP